MHPPRYEERIPLLPITTIIFGNRNGDVPLIDSISGIHRTSSEAAAVGMGRGVAVAGGGRGAVYAVVEGTGTGVREEVGC